MLSTKPSNIEACPRCQSKQFIKYGRCQGAQRYKCKRCAYHFSVPTMQRGIDQQYVQLCMKLYLEGMGFRAIERVVGVSHVSVINWVKKYGQELAHASEHSEASEHSHASEHSEASEHKKKLSAVELDELCSYVGNKKKALGVASCR